MGFRRLIAMTPRAPMTLTVLGLSLRDETLVKSLLAVTAGTTRADWRFVDEVDADVAICDPQSPFARMGVHRYERYGRPHCVALVYGDEESGAMPYVLRAPIRVGELLKMLDYVSEHGALPSSLQSGHAAGRNPFREAPAVRSGDASASVIDTVRERVVAHPAGAEPAAWRFAFGDMELQLLLPEGRCLSRDPNYTLEALAATAAVSPLSRVEQMDRSAVAADAVSRSKPVNALYWHVGLNTAPNEQMPWFAADVALRLRQWPDFGLLGAHRPYLALAALMTNATWRFDDLLAKSGQRADQVRSFVIACGFCGLLHLDQVSAVAPAKIRPAPEASGVSKLFRSIRSALRMKV